MILPTVHLNGTSKNELARQLLEAHEAVQKAMEALQEAAPNGRDYYVQGASAIFDAQTEHFDRLGRLNSVAKELEEIAQHVLG